MTTFPNKKILCYDHFVSWYPYSVSPLIICELHIILFIAVSHYHDDSKPNSKVDLVSTNTHHPWEVVLLL